jgi:hypothetical protein
MEILISVFAEHTNNKDGRIGKTYSSNYNIAAQDGNVSTPQYPCKKTMLHVIAICALRLRVKALPNYEVVAP